MFLSQGYPGRKAQEARGSGCLWPCRPWVDTGLGWGERPGQQHAGGGCIWPVNRGKRARVCVCEPVQMAHKARSSHKRIYKGSSETWSPPLVVPPASKGQ